MSDVPAVVQPPQTPWDATWRLAQRVAGTPFVPTALQRKPEAVFSAILYGQELGLGPMQSLAQIHVIQGRPAAAPELMRALVARHGHRIDVVEASAEKVTLRGKRADTGSEATVTWTMDDARRAKLAGSGAWVTYPRAMLLARCTSELCRMVFPDVIAGLSYTPEEAAEIGGQLWDEVPVDPLSGQPVGETLPDDSDIVDADVVDEGNDSEQTALPVDGEGRARIGSAKDAAAKETT